MKRIALIAIALLAATNTIAQQGSAVYNMLKQKYNYVYWEDKTEDNDAYYMVYKYDYRGIYNVDGKEIIPAIYNDIIISIGRDRKSTFKVRKDGLYGIIDFDGKMIIPAKYTKITVCYQNYLVTINGKTGLLNSTGKTIIPLKYNSIESKRNGFFVKVDDKGGLLDSVGNVVIPLIKGIKDISSFRGYHTVTTSDGKGVWDNKGKKIMSPGDFDYVLPDGKTQTIHVKNGNKHGLYDFNNRLIIAVNCPDFVYLYGDYYGCSYKVGDGKRWQIFNLKGVKIYEGPSPMISEKVLAFQKDSLWGFMSLESGKVLVEPRFTDVEPFSNGVAKVNIGETSYLITNPLKDGGKMLSSLTAGRGAQSDIDRDIPKTTRVAENTFAVIIANEDYADFSVPFVINDGLIFKEYCAKTLGIPASNITFIENATLNNILGALKRAADIANAFDGDAQIIFYYAGMGLSDNAGHSYILPSDGSPKLLSSTAISLVSIYDKLGSLNTDWAIAILDAGFTNENRDGKVPQGIAAKAPKDRTEAPKGNLAVLTATSPSEAAMQYGKTQHGMLTYFLCQKLKQSKGDVTFQSLGDYVVSNTASTSQKENGRTQHPQLIIIDEKLNNRKL